MGRIFGNSGGTGGGGAPDDAVYIVGKSDASLKSERVVTDTKSIAWDLATAGQVKANRTALTGDVTAAAGEVATTLAAVVPFFTWEAPSVGNSTSARYMTLSASVAASATESDGQHRSAVAGVIRNLTFGLEVALVTANLTITVRINGVATAITCTIAAGATSGSDLTHSAAVAVGDKVSIEIVASAADNSTSRPRSAVGFSRA